MPVIKIHISSTVLPFKKPILVKEVRKALGEVLGIDERLGQVILYEALPQLRSVHESRNGNFVLIEITLKPGIAPEMKKELMKRINTLAAKHLEIEGKDISCCIIEIPMDNWYEGIE